MLVKDRDILSAFNPTVTLFKISSLKLFNFIAVRGFLSDNMGKFVESKSNVASFTEFLRLSF